MSSSSTVTSPCGSQTFSDANDQVENVTTSKCHQKQPNLPEINCTFGSNTSINSILTEDGRIITPPPRRKSLSRQNLSKIENMNVELDRKCSSSSSWRNHSLEYSHLATASNTSVNKILTSNGFVTPPERIKSKMQFGSSGHINGKTLSPNSCRSVESLKPQLPSKCRSSDSINRVLTTNGIVTPPPRRFFNRSLLSLQIKPKNNSKKGID